MTDEKRISQAELMQKIEKDKDRYSKVRYEKNIFLGEFKERVLVALTKEEIKEKGVYFEVEEALESPEASKMIISRELDFNNIKKYICLAKLKKISYKILDCLVCIGDVGLVVVSDEALENQPEDPIVKSKKEKFSEKKLPKIYYDSLGKKICKYHLDIIRKELPEFEDEYEEIGFLDTLIGVKCPICMKLGGKKRG